MISLAKLHEDRHYILTGFDFIISVHNHLHYNCFDDIEDFVIQVQERGFIGRKKENKGKSKDPET